MSQHPEAKLKVAMEKFSALPEAQQEDIQARAAVMAEETVTNFAQVLVDAAEKHEVTPERTGALLETFFGDVTDDEAVNATFETTFNLAVAASIMVIMEDEGLL